MSNIKPPSGIGMIALERQEQIFKHGRDIAQDQKYYSRDVFQQMAVAILHQNRKEWPEGHVPIAVFEKIIKKDKIQQIAVAGAILAAMIDYLTMKVSTSRFLEMENATNQTFLMGEVAQMPVGAVASIIVDSLSNTVKSESTQDLYATYLVEAAQYTNYISFEEYLRNNQYIPAWTAKRDCCINPNTDNHGGC